MGKKATRYLLYNIFIVFTIFLALAAVGGWLDGRTDPNECDLYLYAGLGLTVILALNLLLLIYWSIKKKIWLIFPLAAILLNVGYVNSMYRLPLGGNKQKPYDIKIATYNVHGFHGSNIRKTVYETASMLKKENVEIACFQEFYHNRKFNIDSIASALSFMPYYIYEPNKIAVFSKYPITASQFIPFEDTDNSAMWAEIDINGQKARIINVHMQTTGVARAKRVLEKEAEAGNVIGEKEAFMELIENFSENSKIRARQAEKIRIIKDTFPDTPLILCGDFNDTPASFTYKTLKGNLKDGFRERGKGYAGTFRGFKGLLRIDYIFNGNGLECVKYYSIDTSLSDHNPVFSELSF